MRKDAQLIGISDQKWEKKGNWNFFLEITIARYARIIAKWDILGVEFHPLCILRGDICKASTKREKITASYPEPLLMLDFKLHSPVTKV